THPRLDGAERMLDGLAPQLHGVWLAVQSRLRSLEDVLALPSPNAPLLARRAVALERAVPARVRPIDVEHAAVFFTRHAARELLPGWTQIAIVFAIVDEVILVEPTLGPCIRRRTLRNIDVDAGVLASGDLLAVEVAFVGEHLNLFGLEHITRLLGHP